MAADNPRPDVESALTSLTEESDQRDFLETVAAGEIVLPQMQANDDPEGGVQLPYVEQEGTNYVLAFSTQQRFTESGIEAEGTVTVNGAQLASAWPDDEELWLAINPGSEQSVALPPDAVRALPSLAGTGG